MANAQGYGLLAADEAAQVDAASVFHAASMSKLVTAVGVLRLVGLGHLPLDEDVNGLLRSWRLERDRATGQTPVTLRMLLSHQGGVVDPEGAFDTSPPDLGDPPLLHVLRGECALNPRPVRVELAPGGQFSYSDAGFCVVEQVMVDVTRTSFDDLMNELVLDPLHMTRSRFGLPLAAQDDDNVAVGHDKHGSVVDGRRPHYPYLAAAGLWSTPSDLAAVLAALHRSMTHRGSFGLDPEHAQDLVRGQLDTPWAGLGTFVSGDGERAQLASQGWGVGFQCMLRARPRSGEAVVVMTNCDPGRPQDEALTGPLVGLVEAAQGWYRP